MRKWHLPLVFFLVCLLPACVLKNNKQPDTILPRIAPSHMHWLQKQSMLAQAPELIAQVSQSERLWLQPSRPNRHTILLEAAPNWLLAPAISPPYFLSASRMLGEIRSAGYQGLYLGETGEKPDIWHSGTTALPPASLEFDPAFGTDADYAILAEKAASEKIELGSTILEASTGMGPDFFLQARNAPGYGGLYAMLPVPRDKWPLLPQASQWAGVGLNKEDVQKLADLLPQELARDHMAWAARGGWAATGEITGSDGVARRWLYRYADTPAQPVLAWHDPSGLADKIFSGAIIRNTGLLGQSLAGLSLEALMGLEPGTDSTLAPGLAALSHLSAQIHRYGGWSLQTDPLPPAAIESVLKGGTDFCRDAITELLVTFGYYALDGRPTAELYRAWINTKLPVARLARGMAGPALPTLLAANPEWAHITAFLQNAPHEDERFTLFLQLFQLGLPGLAFSASADPTPQIRRTLAARAALGLAQGQIQTVVRGNGGGFGITSILPTGSVWLLACNFGKNPDHIHISLPGELTRAVNAGTGAKIEEFNGQKFTLAIDGHTAQNIFFTHH